MGIDKYMATIEESTAQGKNLDPFGTADKHTIIDIDSGVFKTAELSPAIKHMHQRVLPKAGIILVRKIEMQAAAVIR